MVIILANRRWCVLFCAMCRCCADVRIADQKTRRGLGGWGVERGARIAVGGTELMKRKHVPVVKSRVNLNLICIIIALENI